MAHNFRLLTNYYIGKAGRNGGDGSPDNPFTSLQYANPSVGSIGTGTYVLTGSILQYGPLYGDGTATVQVPIGLRFFTHSNVQVTGVSFDVSGEIGHGAYGNAGSYQGYETCVLRGRGAAVLFTSQAGGAYPVLRNCLVSGFVPDNDPSAYYWRVFNTYLFTGTYRCEFLVNSYTAPDCTAVVNLPAACGNSNLRGPLVVNGTTYATLAAAKAANSSWFPGCISVDPGFNNTFAQDYSLTPGSVHNTLSIGPAQLRQASSIFLMGPVGDVDAASGHYYLDSATGLQIPIVWTDGNIVCTQQNGQNRLKVREAVNGPFSGQYRTGFHVLGDTPQQVEYINFLGGNNSDTDFPTAETLFNPNAPEPSNNNVPNARNYVSGHAGRNPNRWELDVWFGNKDYPSLSDPNDFTNGATPISVEWNGPALYNPLTLIGNGDPGFDALATGGNAPRKIQAKYLVYLVTLRNDNYSR